MEKRVKIKKARDGKSCLAAARVNLIRFCEILDDLPANFNFTLSNPSLEYFGCWQKVSLDGKATAWHNGTKVLLNSSFFPIKREVIEAIEKEGWQVGELSFFHKKSKKPPLLSKEKVEELYYKEKKSLQEIADEYGYTKQWISLLMEKYGQKRRDRIEAVIEADKQRKGRLKK